MQKATLLCIAAAVALAGASMTAEASRKLTREQQAKVAKVTVAQRGVVTPRTMKDAARTVVTNAKTGTTGIAVPLQLDTQLGVRTDANGKLEVVEFNGDATSVPASGVSDE